jgi:kinetochore protein NNF1
MADTPDTDPQPQPQQQPQIQSDPQPQPQPQPQPGPRAQRLQQVYAASLSRTLDKLSYENISTCYPTIARRASPTLRQVQGQMVERLRDKCEREFDAIMGARDVVRKMNDLEGLIADAEGRRKLHAQGDAVPTP